MSQNRISTNQRGRQVVSHNRSRLDAKSSIPAQKQQTSRTFIRSTLVLLLLNGVIYSHMNLRVQADDSAAAPAFDMGTLASLASNLGSNPQIMSLVSSFLNPGGGQQKPAVGSANALGSSIASELGSVSDLETNSITSTGLDKVEPLKRGSRVSSEQQTQIPTAAPASSPTASSPTSPATSAPAPAPAASNLAQSAPSSPANPLGGLMSMLPGMLSGLSGGSGGGLNLGSLSSLLGLDKPVQAPSSASLDSNQASAPVASAAAAPNAASAPPIQQPAAATNQPVTAQQVINLVLTSYASGQIPNKLIQLGLSGRVPPAIIELALSGQVPLEMIRMVITGQVPIATINAFLGSMQQSQAGQSAAAAGGPSASASAKPSSPGVFTATRNLFEGLFSLARPKDLNHPEGSKSGITVPTLIGPIPLKMPSLPNMRSIGQLVGGTITNFSSMIPF